MGSLHTPDLLKRFSEVIFMSALFERTLLYQMWTTLFDVAFIEHPAFPATSISAQPPSKRSWPDTAGSRIASARTGPG